jgi:hypothetical protein
MTDEERKLLRIPDWTANELAELGPGLRSWVEDGLAARNALRRRMGMPTTAVPKAPRRIEKTIAADEVEVFEVDQRLVSAVARELANGRRVTLCGACRIGSRVHYGDESQCLRCGDFQVGTAQVIRPRSWRTCQRCRGSMAAETKRARYCRRCAAQQRRDSNRQGARRSRRRQPVAA